jgi:hypothetical protein
VRLRLALAALLLWTAPIAAQSSRARVDVVDIVPANALTHGPGITSTNLLSDPNTRRLLREGFPARIHYRLELWRKGGWFDDLDGRTEWDVLVAYDPTTQLYNVLRRTSDDAVHEDFGGFRSATSAEEQVSKMYRASLHPNRSGRFYYDLNVDIETLTVSDLDALQQWYRGTTAPGADGNPLTALRSGVGTLLSRVLGGSKVHYQRTSGVFAVR